LILIAALAAAGYTAAASYLYVAQEDMVFPKYINEISVTADTLKAKPLMLEREGKPTLHGGGIGLENKHPQTLVIVFGGNAHDVAGFVNYWGTDILPANASVTVIGYAYRGYGTFLTPKSEGTPTQDNILEDAADIIAHSRAIYPAQKLVLVGYSLGASVAAHAAYALQNGGQGADALVMVTPFASIKRMASEGYPWLPVSTLLKYPFNTEAILGKLTLPITLMPGSEDTLIPPAHLGYLTAAQPAAHVLMLEGTNHGDALYHPALKSYLATLTTAGVPQR
ncbi:MAG: hypothetical protein COY40_01465, partial [Alphaproteobacteria bacterium CG_4_10_14_0_8_um_filter_53_9]